MLPDLSLFWGPQLFYLTLCLRNSIPHPGLRHGEMLATMDMLKRGDSMEQKKTDLQLTEKEAKLIRMLRQLKFGEAHIYVADGQPVRAEEIKKSIKF